jgi:DNA-3-methyladenine glycosylase II
LKTFCDEVRKINPSIQRIHDQHGYPPYWKRPNSFESLCKTIIEQQVSLSSATASFNRLKNYCGDITPSNVVKIEVETFRANGITKQKARYLNLLSQTLIDEPDFFEQLEKLDNDRAKTKLISLKGIGHWTANVYMLVALNRLDIYPDFDVALINSIAYEIFDGEKIDNEVAKNFILQFAPYRSMATCYFYHAYINRKQIQFIP